MYKSIQLTQKLVYQLFELLDTPNISEKIKKRVRVVLTHGYEGLSCTATSACEGASPQFVKMWSERVHDQGINGIYDLPRPGRPPKATEQVKQLIKKAIDTPPGEKKIGAFVHTWSLALLRAYLRDTYDILFSKTHLRRILKDLKYSYRKIGEGLLRRDPDYYIKAAYVQQLLQKPPPHCRVISVDEKGPIHARFHNGKRWQSHHHRLEVTVRNYFLNSRFTG